MRLRLTSIIRCRNPRLRSQPVCRVLAHDTHGLPSTAHGRGSDANLFRYLEQLRHESRVCFRILAIFLYYQHRSPVLEMQAIRRRPEDEDFRNRARLPLVHR